MNNNFIGLKTKINKKYSGYYYYTYNRLFFIQIVTLDAKKLTQSCCSHPLDTSFAINPSHMTEGETWIPFCLENLAKGRIEINIYMYNDMDLLR